VAQVPPGAVALKTPPCASDRPTVAGLELPLGRGRVPLEADGQARPAFWSTDEEVAHPHLLAHRLAMAFQETGLWPVIWTRNDDPAKYCAGPRPGPVLRSAEAAAVLRRLDAVAGRPGVVTFTRLAEASLAPGAEPRFEPFAAYERWARSVTDDQPLGPAQVMLVPCRIPADALAAVGLRTDDGRRVEPAIATAVFRSWQERFGAIPVAFAPASVVLAVGAPPTTRAQASALAGEQLTLTPADEQQTIGERASQLLGQDTNPVDRDVWWVDWSS